MLFHIIILLLYYITIIILGVGGTNAREDKRYNYNHKLYFILQLMFRILSNGVQIVVGTPGRVNQMITTRALKYFLLLQLLF